MCTNIFCVINDNLYTHNYYNTAWQRPTLTGTKSQLPSALRSLTSVFGMGTGVTFSPLLPDYLI